MKTIESMRTLCRIDRDAFHAEVKDMRYNIEQLDKAISDAVASGKSVRESAKQLIKEIDETAALVTVASLVNRFSWDGRISRRNADRAATVENAWSGDAMTELDCSCRAHTVHIDQLADYILDGLNRNKIIDEICSEFAVKEVILTETEA